MRASRWILAACLVASSLSGLGCSLVWTPQHADAAAVDGGFDAGHDAAFDAGSDGGHDAGIDAALDAWVRVDEDCTNDVDDDGDRLADCDDPDCFGAAQCCSDTSGVELGGTVQSGATPLPDWSTSVPISVSGSEATPNFGTGGYLMRDVCTPLARGAELSFNVGTQPVDGTLDVLLSPASAPMVHGFVDEVALHFASDGSFSVTRGGDLQELATPTGSCSAYARDATHYAGVVPRQITLSVRPAAVDGRSVLAVEAAISTGVTGCAILYPLDGFTIDVRDLRRTSDSLANSCSSTPGLYVVLAGTGAHYSFEGPTVSLHTFECASPGVFEPVTGPDLTRENLATTVPLPADDFAIGGIGAPDLSHAAGSFRLLYDGALEERSTEIFRRLTTRIGRAESASLDANRWTEVPNELAASVREPSIEREGTDLVVYASANGSAFDLYRADGDFSTVQRVASAASCSFREPVPVVSYDSSRWVFFRCDAGTRSTLALGRLGLELSGFTVESMDLLASTASTIATRVRAIDVLTRRDAEERVFAVWVLADAASGASSARELHLFIARAEERDHYGGADVPPAPSELTPYAGNPVLTTSDLADGCTGACEITSFAVDQIEADGAADHLRFLFARTRVTAAGTVYELVPLEQVAPRVLDASP